MGLSKFSQARIDIGPALATVKFFITRLHHTARALSALRRCGINFGRINVITDAMYHTSFICQLRMSVNNFANDLQVQNVLWLTRG